MGKCLFVTGAYFPQNGKDPANQEKTPEQVFAETQNPPEAREQSQGVDNQMGFWNLHHWVKDEEHFVSPGVWVARPVNCLIVNCPARPGAEPGVCGVQVCIEVEQDVVGGIRLILGQI